ncbi:hypothetical protein D3C86_1456060 [compost metagenome]
MGNVVAHPAQSGNLIQHSVVARTPVAFLRELWMGEEAHVPDTIGDGNHHHTQGCQTGAVEHGLAGRTGSEGTAVDPHHHRQALLVVACRRPYIQIETVLALSAEIADQCIERGLLHRRLRKGLCGAHAAPVRGWGGCAPS